MINPKQFRIALFLGLVTSQICETIRQKTTPSYLEVSKVIVIQEGETCYRLQCPIALVNSSGDSRAFNIINIIWILHKAHVVIGGGTKEVVNLYKNYNHEKYIYIRGTGELQINNLSLTDAGVYRCIVELTLLGRNSSGTASQYFYETAAIELVSNAEYAKRPQQFTGDITRAILTAAGTLLFLSITCIVYSYRWKGPKTEKLDIEASSSCHNDRDRDPDGSYQNWEAAFEESKSSAENAICSISDKTDIQPLSTRNEDEKIFTISSKSEKPPQDQTSVIAFSPSCNSSTRTDSEATLIPPSDISPTLPSSMLLMRRKLEEAQQDGISVFPGTPHASTSGRGKSFPLFQFESTTCSTVTGRADACQRKLMKQQWWWNWADSNISSETSITNKDSIAVETMQKLVAVPPITSPSSSEYSSVSTVSSSVAQKSSTTTLNLPVQMQSNL